MKLKFYIFMHNNAIFSITYMAPIFYGWIRQFFPSFEYQDASIANFSCSIFGQIKTVFEFFFIFYRTCESWAKKTNICIKSSHSLKVIVYKYSTCRIWPCKWHNRSSVGKLWVDNYKRTFFCNGKKNIFLGNILLLLCPKLTQSVIWIDILKYMHINSFV